MQKFTTRIKYGLAGWESVTGSYARIKPPTLFIYQKKKKKSWKRDFLSILSPFLEVLPRFMFKSYLLDAGSWAQFSNQG